MNKGIPANFKPLYENQLYNLSKYLERAHVG